VWLAKRAIALLTELAWDTNFTGNCRHKTHPSTWARSIELRLDRINQVLGPVDLGEDTGEILQEDVERILTALGCQLKLTESAGPCTMDGHSATLSLSGLRAGN
jgi:phenylalanyl-tRNA synthetase beta chain